MTREPGRRFTFPQAAILMLAVAWIVAGLGSTARAFEPPPVTKRIACRWAVEPPKLDGKLDDPAWKAATVIDHFPTFWEGKDNGKTTEARLLWDTEALYIGAKMTDTDLKAFGTRHNDELWNGDVFEIFLKPSLENEAYYEFQVNPRSVILEIPFPKRRANVGPFSRLKPLGMTAIARVDGTVDKPGDVDTGWTVEIKIPWTAFEKTGGRPQAGTSWSLALCRYDYGPKGTDPVLMSSAPLTAPDFHKLEDYSSVRFDPPLD